VRLQIPEDGLGVVDAPLQYVAAGQEIADGRVQLRRQPLLHRRRKVHLVLADPHRRFTRPSITALE
jgi:hypothetical protein